MRSVAYPAMLGLALATSGANAQQATPEVQEAAPPTVLCIADPPQQQAEAGAQGDEAKKDAGQKPEKPSVAKDVGSAVGGTAGQIAGAAVAGPIGAAAGGVVVERVGRAVGSLVKGDKKKERKAEQSAGASAKCVAEAPAQPAN